jgi:hypothetical protein
MRTRPPVAISPTDVAALRAAPYLRGESLPAPEPSP